MVFAFVGVMPFGLLVLRIMGWVRWHGINQTFAAILALIGMCCGIYLGTMYNRTKKFNSAHQIFGLVIMLGLMTQVALGIMHHRIYKQTQSPTKFAPIHVWLGRLVIPAGVANGFLGFPLALATHYNYVLLALVLLVFFPVFGLMCFFTKRSKRKAKEAAMGVGGSSDPKLFGAAAPYESWNASQQHGIPMANLGHGQPVEPWRGV